MPPCVALAPAVHTYPVAGAPVEAVIVADAIASVAKCAVEAHASQPGRVRVCRLVPMSDARLLAIPHAAAATGASERTLARGHPDCIRVRRALDAGAGTENFEFGTRRRGRCVEGAPGHRQVSPEGGDSGRMVRRHGRCRARAGREVDARQAGMEPGARAVTEPRRCAARRAPP